MDITDITPEEAKLLFAHGAVLIIAGVPEETEFGIDLYKNVCREMFRGIKMIPAGPHFVYTAAKGPYGDYGSRVGFIHYFKPQEIVIREWDPEKEQLRLRQTNDEEVEKQRIRENLMELDRYLAPFDYGMLEKWRCLSRHITENTIEKLAPDCGLIKSSVDFESCPDSDRPKGNQQQSKSRRFNPKIYLNEEDYLPQLKVIQNTAYKYTVIPKRCPENATPTQITLCHMDSIQAVEELMNNYSNFHELIEEIQFSFVLFLVGYSIDSLAHWRLILNLMSNTEQSIDKFSDFYLEYLDVLQYQLPELPEELMPATANNTVYKDVQRLIVNCSNCGMKNRADAFAEHLSRIMLWSFDGIFDEDPEDLPVIVETT